MVASRVIAGLKSWRRYWRDMGALRSWDNNDERRLKFYATMVPQNALIFDVGANVGNRAKIFAKLSRKVVAFEPQPYCVSVLSKGGPALANVSIVPCALGRKRGNASMMVSDAHTLSTMAPDWIEAVRRSGRFGSQTWERRINVEVTTLDSAIAEHGLPDFIKVDVEGFEAEVIGGLSKPVPALSLEFTPEHASVIRDCIAHLSAIASYEFNTSLGESMVLEFEPWLDGNQVAATVEAYGPKVFGDVYARLRAGRN